MMLWVHASGCLLLHGTNIHNSPYKLQRWSGQYEVVMREKKRGAYDTSKQLNVPFAAWENEHTLEWIFTTKSFILKTQHQLHPDTWWHVWKTSGKTCMSDIDVLDSEDSLLIKTVWHSVHVHSPTCRHRRAQTHSLMHIHIESCVLNYFTLAVELPPVFCSLLTEFHVFFMHLLSQWKACVSMEELSTVTRSCSTPILLS